MRTVGKRVEYSTIEDGGSEFCTLLVTKQKKREEASDLFQTNLAFFGLQMERYFIYKKRTTNRRAEYDGLERRYSFATTNRCQMG